MVEPMTEKDIVIAFRIPKALKAVLDEYVRMNLHLSSSEVCRESLREKLAGDAPELYHRFFKEERGQ